LCRVVGGLDNDSRDTLNCPDRFRVNGRLTGGHSGTLIIWPLNSGKTVFSSIYSWFDSHGCYIGVYSDFTGWPGLSVAHERLEQRERDDEQGDRYGNPALAEFPYYFR
jgi:hypothetical protein